MIAPEGRHVLSSGLFASRLCLNPACKVPLPRQSENKGQSRLWCSRRCRHRRHGQNARATRRGR